MLLRPATPADAPALAALDAEAFSAEGYPVFVFRQWLDLFEGLVFVAEGAGPDAGALAGYAAAGVAADGACGWILSAGVTPAARGRGLARRLAQAALDALAARGIREVRLTVAPGNAAARAVYRHLGFADEALVPDYFGPGEDRLVMRRVIAG
ncbi:MAG: GNAT family N-acetyltransferase [Rubricoccaceae bacterium]